MEAITIRKERGGGWEGPAAGGEDGKEGGEPYPARPKLRKLDSGHKAPGWAGHDVGFRVVHTAAGRESGECAVPLCHQDTVALSKPLHTSEPQDR